MIERSAPTSADAPFTVRPGRIDDAAELWRLVGLLADHVDDRHRYHSTPESFAHYGFGARPLFETLLAFEGPSVEPIDDDGSHEAIGACVYLPDFSTWQARPGVYILDLVVEPDHRGRGIGSALLADATRRGRKGWDADYVILAVDRSNEGAIRFYEREGFESDDHGRVMIRRGLGSGS